MNAVETLAEVAEAIDRQVESILQQADIFAPPVDALSVAKCLDMELAWDNKLVGRARFVRLQRRRHVSAGNAILLRPEPRGERRHWAVAHEIGESIACHVFSDLGIDPTGAGETAREQIANLFASRLLLPTAWFHTEATTCEWDLLELKSCFATASHEIIARRMIDFEPQIVVTICDQGAVTFRRGNTGSVPPPMLEMERACQQAVHHSGQPYSDASDDLVVQGWPVREEGWRREILRLAMP